MQTTRIVSALPLRTLLLSVLGSLAAVACSTGGAEVSVAAGEGSSAIIRGASSDATQNAVVLLVMIDRGEGGIGQCTGTMLAPNLVLTARHCVSATQDGGLACKADGTPIAGGRISKDKKPEDIYVVVGTQRPSRPEANGQGAKLFVNEATHLCNNDIALVLLKEPIKDVPIAPIRLDAPAVKGELVTAVGWGVTDKTPNTPTRQQRAGIEVQGVGGDPRQQTGPSEFSVGESICSGDSGGPAIAETSGAIVGVVSRGGNGTAPTRNPASSCVGANASNIYTGVAGFKEMILAAYEEAGFDPWLEGRPDPRLAKDGGACTEGLECRSNACVAGKCTASCAKDPCAAGTTCQDSGGAKVCLPPPAPPAPVTASGSGDVVTTTGCSVAGQGAGADGPSHGHGLASIACVAALVAAASRRRRKAG